ncbi:DUF1430 domain-containing protein [Streptococcus suis]|uniref:DUF1430 domain-containing protein n=1 Tax=Streptococcus suis TaxID=1307 RepID=UPI0005CF1BA8|nr:DUF1430 domain-containing protein [Streptococcus suis]NQG58507.1 DUF1430 domain-containing protein [Streptococcus suis]CYV96354.1 Bacteriocin-associated integral membrane protein [Streptococcus suis]
MKGKFVLVSTIILAVFMIWLGVSQKETMLVHYYPSVTALSVSEDVTYSDVRQRLEDYSQQTDSIIARRVIEPSTSGGRTFSYDNFSQSSLPRGLEEFQASEKVESALLTKYFIFQGKATVEELRSLLVSLGFDEVQIRKPSTIATLLAFLTQGGQFLAILVFLITYMALVVIANVRQLRTAGIRLIAGDSRWHLFLLSLQENAKEIALTIPFVVLPAVGLAYLIGLDGYSVYYLVAALVGYHFLLGLIVLFFAATFTLAIRTYHFLPLLKGKMPLQGILTIMVMGQMLALLVVSLGVAQTVYYSGIWQEYQAGAQQWENEGDYYSLAWNISAYGRSGLNSPENWYPLLKQAWEEDGALFVKSNLNAYLMGSQLEDGTRLDSYHPAGNTLYVSPNYLQIQDVNLAEGEFQLLLPEKLRPESDTYLHLYQDYINRMVRPANQARSATIKGKVAYLKNGQKQFIYNHRSGQHVQYLTDPILVVLAPSSLGKESADFWLNEVDSSILFKNRDKLLRELKARNLFQFVNEVKSSSSLFTELLDRIRIETISTSMGAILGIVTSIILFNTMNLLYFEEFKREIFIKEIAGMDFLGIHKKYLTFQLLSLLLALGASMVVTGRIFMSSISFALFMVNALCLLRWQARKEGAWNIRILKGA